MITITVNQGRFHVYVVYKLPYLTFAQALRKEEECGHLLYKIEKL
jgi:hypothetical protein